jgi:formylmethanofuran dehydrogenase subunit A
MEKITNETVGFLHLNFYRVISSDGEVKIVMAKDKSDAELISGFEDILAIEKPGETAEDSLYRISAYDMEHNIIDSEKLEKDIRTKYGNKERAIKDMRILIKGGEYSTLILKAFYPDGRVTVVHEEIYEKVARICSENYIDSKIYNICSRYSNKKKEDKKD